MRRRHGAWVGSGVAGAAGLVTALLGPVTNYASNTVPQWASHAWAVWSAFGVLVSVSIGLLLWGRRLDAAVPALQLRAVGGLATTQHASLRRQHVERVRGREAELATLTQTMRRPQGRFAVVCGAGGLGKTTLAAQLAVNAEESGWAVFWLRWRNSVDLAQQLMQVALACGLPEQSLESARVGRESLPDVVWRQLEASRRWLIVIDNVDEPQAVELGGEPLAHYRGWIRPSGGGLLLVTSRDSGDQTWGSRADVLRLEPLDVADAGRVLMDLAPRSGTEAQAAELAARLGGLPLALHAAGSYLATATSRYRSFDQYRQALDAEFPTLLGAQHSNASDPDVARSVVRHTWELSLDQLAAEGATLARPLLRLLALLALAPVPLTVLTPGLLAAVTEEPATMVGLDIAVAGLYRYGLLGLPHRSAELEASQDRIAEVVLHPLVREISALAVTSDPSESMRWHRALIDRLSEAVCDVVAEGRSGWSTALLLAPHLNLLAEHSSLETLSSARDTIESLARVLHNAGAYVTEQGLYQQLCSAQDRLLGAGHPDLLRSRNRLAITLVGMGEYVRAVDVHRQILTERLRALGSDHPETLTSQNNLAWALQKMGHYAQAADLHQRTLNDRLRILGPDHAETLVSRADLAWVLAELGEYAEAVDLHRRNLGDRVRVLGPDHPSTLRSRSGLANALFGMGEYAEAAGLHRRTLEDRLRLSGPDHPETVGSRNSLATALFGMGEYAEAAGLHRRTLEDRLRVSGPDHPNTLRTVSGLANALFEMGDYEQALDLHRRALEGRTRVLGVSHPDTVHSRNDLEEVLATRRLANRRGDGWRRHRPAPE
ncbi:tetratricopeptide repeat protein [Streptomyces sp. NPDC059945]